MVATSKTKYELLAGMPCEEKGSIVLGVKFTSRLIVTISGGDLRAVTQWGGVVSGKYVEVFTEFTLQPREKRALRILIVGRLAAAFRDDAVLAEERGASAGRSGRRWIIDPLDGTTNYAHGLRTFTVSIALESAKRVELGVIYDPNLDELFVAERGSGTTVKTTSRSPSRPRRPSTRACWRRGFPSTSVRAATTT